MTDDPTNPNIPSHPPGAVVIAVFTTEPQADLALGLLQAENIPAWLHADDCGGMLAFLDTASGVRLLVLPENASEARSILSATASPNVPPIEAEATASPPPSPPEKFSPMQSIAGLVVGVLLCLLYQWVDRLGTKTYEYDTNHDGKPDTFSIYRDGYPIEESFDRNHDGRRDSWYYSDGQENRLAWKTDDNFDGVVDATYLYSNNVLVSSWLDTDYNTIPDVNYTYEHELATQADWRPNGTNAVTLRQFFKHAVLTEEWRDTNADGAFDVTVRYDAFFNAVATNTYVPK